MTRRRRTGRPFARPWTNSGAPTTVLPTRSWPEGPARLRRPAGLMRNQGSGRCAATLHSTGETSLEQPPSHPEEEPDILMPGSGGDPQSLLDTVLTNVVQTVGGRAGIVRLWDHERRRASVTSSYGLSKELLKELEPLIDRTLPELDATIMASAPAAGAAAPPTSPRRPGPWSRSAARPRRPWAPFTWSRCPCAGAASWWACCASSTPTRPPSCWRTIPASPISSSTRWMWSSRTPACLHASGRRSAGWRR